ncbi:hypothetical protein H6P81_016188 [Aristolochia fimbriata]|uniref:Reverse transcriptase domain-containing protein n=1 Tax=Aristolochia fimbriata TaxID=158543 RepID=A0AAV7E7P9_ARIFI|nr:hypothetical protein H6P81_016188 [Aristolochia fimbriata]
MTVDAYELEEILTSGKTFTWSNGQNHPTLSRLDRFLASGRCLRMYPEVSGTVGGKVVSNHWPIFLDTRSGSWGHKPFRFENWWLKEEGFQEMMKTWWEEFTVQGQVGGCVAMKLKLLKKKLIEWVKLKKAANAAQRSLLRMAACDLRSLVAREHIVWKQRARYKWLKEGDANFLFFHAIAFARRRSNRANSLIVNGELTFDREAITNVVVEFYASLYTAEPGPRHSMEGMPIASLNPDKARWMETHFSLEEIEPVVKTFPMDKAPGPDGFNGEFFRASSEFMKTDVIEMLNDFYYRGIEYRSLGASLIALLPKKEGVENIRDFRPISLISGPYKIVARILAGRLKIVLPDLISKEQNGFIPSRQIRDAAMVIHEVADHFAKSEEPRIILKLDSKKAFDRVDWDFLEAIMRQIGFGERWIGWIRSCVENASFSLLVNGGVFGHFGSSRGLRQGDPLSPFLFNIMGEGLTSLVKAALEVGWLTNVLPEGLIPSSQFADDIIIFGEGTLDQVEKWKSVITLFEFGSGQKVNWSKTKVFEFNIDHEVLQEFATMLGCSVGTLPSEYLGLPLFHSRVSKSLWCSVVEKIQKCLSIWKGKMLSKVGRLILIRACLSGIPMHYLSFMHCPPSVVKELERIYRTFLWKGATEDFKYHLVNWRKVCLPKDKGGLGIHRIALVNKAFMLKWCWRINMDKSAIWYNLVTLNFRVEEITLGGHHTLFWRDIWLGSAPLRISHPFLYRVAILPDATVLEALESNQPHNMDWTCVFRRELRDDEGISLSSLESLLGSFYKDDDKLDSLIWSPSTDGYFTVASAYNALLPSSVAHVSRRAWQLRTPPKVQFFIWSALHGKILTRDVLARRSQQLNSLICPLFNAWMETADHLLLSCEYTWKIWAWFVE